MRKSLIQVLYFHNFGLMPGLFYSQHRFCLLNVSLSRFAAVALSVIVL
jgi:hypothetical protein